MNYSSPTTWKRRPVAGAAELPRIVIWQIVPGPEAPHTGPAPEPNTRELEPLNASECMLVIDSIARTSRPIVVLTGEHILERCDRLEEIIEYGRALGLKMIVELAPSELTDDVLARFARFGERIFRVKISETIREHSDSRIEYAPFHSDLDECLDRLSKAGYETHLVYTAIGPETRVLALVHDYAVRRSAKGVYFHLRFDLGKGIVPREPGDVDDFIRRFATLKEYSPVSMSISPQCVRFVHIGHAAGARADAAGGRGDWEYECLAGRSFAFIDGIGRVQLCGGNDDRGMTLRETGYDFKKIWSHGPSFRASRHGCTQCAHGYDSLSPAAVVQRAAVTAPGPAPGG